MIMLILQHSKNTSHSLLFSGSFSGLWRFPDIRLPILTRTPCSCPSPRVLSLGTTLLFWPLLNSRPLPPSLFFLPFQLRAKIVNLRHRSLRVFPSSRHRLLLACQSPRLLGIHNLGLRLPPPIRLSRKYLQPRLPRHIPLLLVQAWRLLAHVSQPLMPQRRDLDVGMVRRPGVVDHAAQARFFGHAGDAEFPVGVSVEVEPYILVVVGRALVVKILRRANMFPWEDGRSKWEPENTS